jgi:hypothetical protein
MAKHMPTKGKTTTEQSASSIQSLSVDRGTSFDFQPIIEPEIPPSQYEEAISTFLARSEGQKDGFGLQLSGTLSYAMNLVQARSHLKAPVKITWDKPAKGQKNVNTTIRLYLDHSLTFREGA